MEEKKERKVKKSIEKVKQELELKKLELENKQLEYQQSKQSKRIEYLKSLTPLAGFITTILALLTFAFTVYKWSYEEDKNRIYEIDQKVENHISNLFSEKSSDEKYKSIIFLGNYLGKNNSKYHFQILSAMSNYLGQESNPKNRSAINQSFNKINTLEINEKVLKSTLSTLIEISRNKNNLYKLYKLPNSHIDFYKDIDSSSQQAIAIDIGKSITIFLRKRIIENELSNIYCYECDFSNLVIPKTNFENAILTKADFSNTDCSESNFNDADLTKTKFIGAKLIKAQFTSSYFKSKFNSNPSFGNHNYVIRQLNFEDQLHQPVVYYPDFSNSNLTNANFSGHLLFNFNANSITGGVAILPLYLSFNNANLKNTNFENTGIYGATYDNINSKSPKPPIFPFLPFNG